MTQAESICVYCGSSVRAAPHYMNMAYDLGRMLGERGIQLVYGGGGIGLMGRAADGCLDAGGQVTGIIPRHLHDRELAHHSVQDLILVDTMHERKMLMASRSDGFIVLPGGFGTLDEMFEILTWRQLGLHAKPVVLIDHAGYWAPLKTLVEQIVRENFASPEQAAYLTIVDDPEAALAALGIA
jgi:uncharacterized protein (TIGR00730 family)